jgi:hypothetical protein
VARTVAAVALVVASVVLAGCGGEDDEATTKRRPSAGVTRTAPASSGEAPTKEEFLRKANALCAEAKRRAAPISDAVNAKVDNEDAIGVAAELRKGLPIADQFLDGIRALTPPRGDEAIVGRYVDIVAAQRRRIPPLVEALEAEDISSIEVLAAELRQGNRRAQHLTRGYGLTRCGPAGLPAR